MHAHSKKRFELHEAKTGENEKRNRQIHIPNCDFNASLTVTDSMGRHRIHKGVQI